MIFQPNNHAALKARRPFALKSAVDGPPTETEQQETEPRFLGKEIIPRRIKRDDQRSKRGFNEAERATRKVRRNRVLCNGTEHASLLLTLCPRARSQPFFSYSQKFTSRWFR